MTEEQESYTRLDESEPVKRSSLATRREYCWILAKDSASGRPIILGAYNTEEEANQVGFSKIDSGNFEIIPLNTRNVQRANHILKYRRFHQEARLEEVLKRAKHKM